MRESNMFIVTNKREGEQQVLPLVFHKSFNSYVVPAFGFLGQAVGSPLRTLLGGVSEVLLEVW